LDSGIAGTDEHLRQWVQEVVGPVQVGSGVPGPGTDAGVALYPLGLAPSQETRSARRAEPHRFLLSYLVATQGEHAHEHLGTLLVAALERSEWQVELDALTPALWLSLGTAPRPAFVLTVEAIVPRPQRRRGPPVTQPLEVDVTPTRGLEGRVVGPGAVPVPGARVELVGLNTHTRTDARGRFAFPVVPAAGGRVRLRISAKDREYVAAADLGGTDEPVVIHCDLLEE
jgi:hypothetical protein